MGLLDSLKLHTAVAGGDFDVMFARVKLPPLPAAVAKVLEEVNREEPDVAKLETIIGAELELSVRILTTINSSLFALRNEVTSVRHAISLLGFDRVRSVILGYSVHDALPRPPGDLFRHEAYWTDTLLRSLLARSLARRCRSDEAEAAFTAMLVADVAVPVLLTGCQTFYEPMLTEWRRSRRPLAEIEREAHGWDHGRAGAWILRSWKFPERMTALVEAHTSTPSQLAEAGLADSVAPCIATSSLLPSCLCSEPARCDALIDRSFSALDVPPAEWPGIYAEVRDEFQSIFVQFGLSGDHMRATAEVLGAAIRRRGLQLPD
ncbi:MAG: HDOD domain-containing protein [bacterium]|nr:HDOD domain-containing protein [bacterium]